MKKIILIIGIVLAMGLLAGCQQQKAKPMPEDSQTAASADEQVGAEEPVGAGEPSVKAEDIQPAPEGENEITGEEAEADVGVSQEELDELEKEIQGMDFEDLEGVE